MPTLDEREQIAGMAEKAMPLFGALAWKWATQNGERVPVTSARAALTIEELLEHMRANPDARSITSGGLTVEREGDALAVSFTFPLGRVYLDGEEPAA